MTDQPLIGPQVRYPTPWRLANRCVNGQQVIWDASGEEIAAAHLPLAELIVSLVNREADPGMVDMLEANEALQELAGQLAEASAENGRLSRMVEWLAKMTTVAGHGSYSAGQCECGDHFADVLAWQWHRFHQS